MPVVGREAERARLLSLLADVRAGRSRALVIRGPAGIGKTTLLDELERAAGALRIVRVDGLRGDGTTAWAGIRELAAPLSDTASALPVAQAAALGAALGTASESVQVVDHFAVGAAVVTLLASAAERAPLLVLVDDFQWLDRESADAIAFATGRLDAEGVAIVIGHREGEESSAPVPSIEELYLEPLDDAAARALLARASCHELDPATTRRVLSTAAGLPLALLELPSLLCSSLPDVEPTTAVADVYERRIRSLPAQDRSAVTVAAAHRGEDAAVIREALVEMGLDLEHLRAAEAAGLLDVSVERIRFRHPLARSAARRTADPDVLRCAHVALAEALAARGDDEGSARHRASAATEPDETVASKLERAAAAARRRGALVCATELAVEAARVTPTTSEACRRRILAAEVALLAGQGVLAESLLRDLDVSVVDEVTRARAAHLRGRHFVLAGRHRKAMFVLEAAADDVALADPGLASAILAEASAAATHGGEVERSVEMAKRARSLAADHGAEGALARVALGAALAANGGREEAPELLGSYPVLLEQPDHLVTAVPILMAVASGLVWLERFGDAIAFLDPFIARVRRAGAIGALPLALLLKGWAHQRQSETLLAEVALLESIQLADETGQETIALQARATITALYCAQSRGSDVRALAHTVRSALPREAGGPYIAATMSLGGVLLHEGRLEDAVRTLREVVDPEEPGETLALSAYHAAFVNLADAHLRLGAKDAARRIAELLEVTGRERGIDWTLGQAHRLFGLLASDDEVDGHFERATRLLWPFAGVRVCVETCWGERLIDAGRHDEARGHLRSALAEASAAGVVWWTDRAARALRSLGEPVAAFEPPAAAMLTSDELTAAVAYLRTRSLTATAAELFLAPQTVERRVSEAYRKLGVHTPEDLGDRLTGRGDCLGTVLRILGPLAVERDGAALPVPNGVARRLLEIVAVESRVHVDVVAELLWPDEGVGCGRGRLRNVLARLRASIGDVVVRKGDILTLDDGVVVDARRFEEATANAGATPDETARAVSALRWYRGDLLPEAAYEPWAAAPRERLRRRFLRVLDSLADDAARRGDWAEAARFLELAIDSEPYDEDRYLRAADARLRQCRRSSAAALLRRARAIAAELAVPPSPRLIELEAALAH